MGGAGVAATVMDWGEQGQRRTGVSHWDAPSGLRGSVRCCINVTSSLGLHVAFFWVTSFYFLDDALSRSRFSGAAPAPKTFYLWLCGRRVSFQS